MLGLQNTSPCFHLHKNRWDVLCSPQRKLETMLTNNSQQRQRVQVVINSQDLWKDWQVFFRTYSIKQIKHNAIHCVYITDQREANKTSSCLGFTYNLRRYIIVICTTRKTRLEFYTSPAKHIMIINYCSHPGLVI